MTRLIGIDAATRAGKVGLARGRLGANGRVRVDTVALGSTLESIAQTVAGWIRGPTLLAVDAPLGWPRALGASLAEHEAGQAIAAESAQMFNRVTDRLVHQTVGKKPLEVGADRIARTALAALQLIEAIRQLSGQPLPLAWAPVGPGTGVIEVYPAATLLGRGLSTRGYKRDDELGSAARIRILEALGGELKVGPRVEDVAATDHTLDAVLCVLAAADFERGQALRPSRSVAAEAKREGWIWFKPPG
jgi:predicted RNase H-like nuclease